MKAVRFSEYGSVDVLRVEEAAPPAYPPDHVVVAVKAAGINPGETNIRTGALRDMYPTTFPSGEGSDLAGVISEVGTDVENWRTGDEVLGWSWDRASHAELVAVPATQLVRKPESLSWDVAGSLYIAGATAHAAVRAVEPRTGETVAVSGAAGGVGCIAVQLLANSGVHVIAIASDRHRQWLLDKGADVVGYEAGLEQRLRRIAADTGIDAFLDFHGGGYVRLAVELGVPVDRINTVIDFGAAKQYGVKTAASAEGTSTEVLAELADLAAKDEIDVPIAAVYPLTEVRQAFAELEQRHTMGKIVLRP